MALLTILEFPDARLRTKATPVKTVDAAIIQIVDDLFETMYASNGVGLAATQANIHQRIITVDVSEEQNTPLCLINPEIMSREGIQYESEGCLSLPGVYEYVERAATIKVRALDKMGKSIELEADGLLSVCIQHEIDHLDGILFADYLSKLKQDRLRKKLIKIRKQSASA